MPRFNRYKRKLRSARRGWGAGRRAIQLMDPADKRKLFGVTYMQRLKDPSLAEQTPQQRWMRRSMRFRGEGDYTGSQYGLINFGSGGAMTNKVTGLGGYFGGNSFGPTKANAIMEGSTLDTPLVVNASDDVTGDVYLSHREFVGTVTATLPAGATNLAAPFQQTSYALNPALVTSFPWLSQVAANYDLYEFQGLVYEYVPQMSESANASNNLGRVMMMTQYDPEAAPLTNSRAFQNYEFACSAKPSLGLVHGVETKRIQSATNIMYTRTTPPAIGASVKSKIFTDLGNFNIATEGIPFAATSASVQSQILGELWVTYRVKLSRAKLATQSLVTMDSFSNRLQVGTGNSWTPGTEKKGLTNSGLWTITGQAGGAGVSTFNFKLDPSVSSGKFALVPYFEPNLIADAGAIYTVFGFTGLNILGQLVAGGGLANLLSGIRGASTQSGAGIMFFEVTSAPGVSTTIILNLTGAGTVNAYAKFYIMSIDSFPDTLTV